MKIVILNPLEINIDKYLNNEILKNIRLSIIKIKLVIKKK